MRKLVLVLSLLSAAHAHAQTSSEAATGVAADLQTVVDSIADAALRRNDMAGMVVFAMRGGDTLISRAYGRADVENAAPMTIDHVFQFASITKQFTAAAVLKLVQEGRIALDEPITRYLPSAPVQGHTITVRQLLSHTAGIADYAESPRIPALKRLDLPPDSLVALVSATPFYFAPGDQMRYSNTGFALAGQLIAAVSGQPYAEYVEQHVLRPAGAVNAHFCDLRALIPHLARAYAGTANGLRPADYISPHLPYAAGGFCGTAGDLAAWNEELHDRRGGRILSEASYAEMTRAATVRGGRRTRYGLGVGMSDLAGRRAFHHGGDIDGFTTFTAYLPDDSLNVTVLINTQGRTRPDAVAARVVEAVSGVRPVRAMGTPPRDLSAFTGKYGGDVIIEQVVERGTNALQIKRGPMQPMKLRYAGRDASGVTFTDGRARYTFEPRAKGASHSPAMWADLGVALVIWTRNSEP